MAIETTYNEVIDCIVIKIIGTVGYNDILLLRDMIIGHPNFRRDINQLFDCSEGELDLSTSDLENIAFHYMRVSDQLGLDRKLALVVSRDLDYGMMRQYEAFFYSGPNVAVSAFKSLDEAKEWLAID